MYTHILLVLCFKYVQRYATHVITRCQELTCIYKCMCIMFPHLHNILCEKRVSLKGINPQKASYILMVQLANAFPENDFLTQFTWDEKCLQLLLEIMGCKDVTIVV